jgi:hypothetical protein
MGKKRGAYDRGNGLGALLVILVIVGVVYVILTLAAGGPSNLP